MSCVAVWDHDLLTAKQTKILTTKKSTIMKSFFSQTWVVAVLAIAILAVTGAIYVKLDKDDDTKSKK